MEIITIIVLVLGLITVSGALIGVNLRNRYARNPETSQAQRKKLAILYWILVVIDLILMVIMLIQGKIFAGIMWGITAFLMYLSNRYARR